MTIARRYAFGTGVAALALVLGACGSSGGSSGSAGGSSAPAGSGGGGVTISTHQGSMGTYLADSSGRSLYLWVADSNGASKCTGSCASAWPPLTTKGSPKAGVGVKASELGTISRSGGMRQVTYDGHPLYYYSGDSGPGSTTGQGSDGFGAKWWLVTPAGQALTGSGAAPSTSTSTSNGGGYGNGYGYRS